MSTLVVQFFAALDNLDEPALQAMCHKNFSFVDGDRRLNLKEWLLVERAYLNAFPDRSYTFYRESYDGRLTTGTLLISGTHTGNLDLTVFAGQGVLPPTGSEISVDPEYFEIEEITDQIYSIEIFPEEGSGWGAAFGQIGLNLG